MSKPRAFLSFDFDHNEGNRKCFVGQSWNSKTPFEIADWSSKEPLPQHKWEEMIEEKIRKTHMIIVLVGRYMKTASGVVKELSMARRNNIPIFGMYVDQANESSNLPEGLARSRMIDWNWLKIAGMIDQCIKEGKNKI